MSNTRTYVISYEVTTYYDVPVERPADITEDELLSSITRQELWNAQETGDGDGLKEAVREKRVSLILDEEGEQVVFTNG